MERIQKLAHFLRSELDEFDSLEDIHENIEAPLNQLSGEGKFINQGLHAMGIKTSDQVDLLSDLIREIRKLDKDLKV